MIYIDFHGGTHGRFLDFVCNKFLAKINSTHSTPFDLNGASHDPGEYTTARVFRAKHYFFHQGKSTLPESGRIITIRYEEEDLLPLIAITMLRAGEDHDIEDLSTNTYFKMKQDCGIAYGVSSTDIPINRFFSKQIEESYNAVKDPTWPSISTICEFNQLPQHIQDECLNIHKLELYEPLSEDNPNCPTHILREYYKIGFKDPSQIESIQLRDQYMNYTDRHDVYTFPYIAFYNTDRFVKHINAIANWSGYSLIDTEELIALHQEFLTKQPYKNLKIDNDKLLKRLYNLEEFVLPKMLLIEQAYVLANLDMHFGKDLTPQNWFKTSNELYEYIDEC